MRTAWHASLRAVARIGVTATSLALVGCATGYQPQGRGGGYSETQLAENRFQVLYKGNSQVSRDTARDYVLLRSAEVTLENGFTHFVIMSLQSDEDVSTYTNPVTSSSVGTVKGSGDKARMRSTTVTMGGDVSVMRRPIERALIMCYNGSPPAAEKIHETRVFDANLIAKGLRRKYELKK